MNNPMFRDAFVEFRHGSGYRAEGTCRYERMITSFDEVAADLLTEILGLCQAYID